MKTIYLIGNIFSWAIFIYFAANTLYLFIIAICGRLVKGTKFDTPSDKCCIAVLIPVFTGRPDHCGYSQAG